jgi:hypothetical protein
MDLVAFTSTLNPWSQNGETAIQHEQFCTMFTLMDNELVAKSTVDIPV